MLSFPFLSLFVGSAFSYSIPFRRQHHATTLPHSTTFPVSVSVNTSNTNLGFSNVADFLYSATVYVQGQPFQVQIDTGSSDLWLNTQNTTFTGLTDTGYNTTIGYVDGTSATGPIMLANVSLGEFTVSGQAFINAPGSNASEVGVDTGLLGVGPPSSSVVLQQLENSTYNGLNFLDNVFGYYPNESNFISFLLSRSDYGITEGGVMTIGELVENYTQITSTPKLQVVVDYGWFTFMDGIYVNSQFFTGNSLGVEGLLAIPDANQTVILLDTGTSLATAPPFYVDAMYANIPGANFSDDLQSYYLPCDSKINISMLIGGNEYPMNPIDAITVSTDVDNNTVCYGTFSNTPEDAGVDFILGDAFMRNVYTLLDFGSWVFSGKGDPFIQILSVTDANTAWADFDDANKHRLADSQEMLTDTSSFAEAATQTSSVHLVQPSAVSSASGSLSAPVASSRSTGFVTGPSLTAPTARPSTTFPSPSPGDALAAAAIATTSAAASTLDLSGLTRNSYIIMGLLGGAITLLLGVLIKLCAGSRKQAGYRSVPTLGARGPAHFEKPYEPESEAFSTPYDDPARGAGYTQ
ncbi:aspartic peptidase domain-containing protein [Amylocystis lapponica]|nr:aspartic peptidase domain-containing protein [Amylocystis lapponica]